jgi:pimeloyl-ACP methyl ester carboxylesterase
MNCQKNKFEFLNRGKKDTLLLIPGWATDGRIFCRLELDFNYLIPHTLAPCNFSEELNTFLHKNAVDKISLLGWSMGGFIAADFAKRYPEKVKNLVLVSVRKKYDTAGLNEVSNYLKKNKDGYLYRFYRSCFAKNEEKDFHWFKKTFFKQYTTAFSLDFLLNGLDYLAQTQIVLPDTVKTIIVHGIGDIIAPIAEASALKTANPHINLIALDDAGHMPFLRPKFKDCLAGAQ